MRATVLTLALAAGLAGCGGDDPQPAADRGGTPTRIETIPPGQERGARLVAQSGCLACHRIGAQGNDGVGPELTEVGARMPEPAIRRALVEPVAPMPSYDGLPKRDLDAIVDYLVALR